MKKYGIPPKALGFHKVNCEEMMFYQYLPIKMAGENEFHIEKRLDIFKDIIGECSCDFIGDYGLDNFMESYVYISAKYLFVTPSANYNRPGWHSDGFMSDDINYIWCDRCPTLFSLGDFQLTMDHEISLKEMDKQAPKQKVVEFGKNQIVRLDQFNIHRVNDVSDAGMRAFLKVSISKDKYNLAGNTHNHMIDYKWDMKQRKVERNNPISNEESEVPGE